MVTGASVRPGMAGLIPKNNFKKFPLKMKSFETDKGKYFAMDRTSVLRSTGSYF